MTPRRALRIGLVAFGLAAVALPGCARAPGGGEWLDTVRVDSAEAEQKIANGDVAGARTALEHALTLPTPGIANADARVVRQDLLYRLAMLELSERRLGEARRFADEGLSLGRSDDVFTANLLAVRGKISEADGDALSASRDYHEALMINEKLLGRALGDEGTER
jgi:hypothetical protein